MTSEVAAGLVTLLSEAAAGKFTYDGNFRAACKLAVQKIRQLEKIKAMLAEKPDSVPGTE